MLAMWIKPIDLTWRFLLDVPMPIRVIRLSCHLDQIVSEIVWFASHTIDRQRLAPVASLIRLERMMCVHRGCSSSMPMR
jgi:hypothetical protein